MDEAPDPDDRLVPLPSLPAGFSSKFVGDAWTIVQPWSKKFVLPLIFMLVLAPIFFAAVAGQVSVAPLAFLVLWTTVVGGSLVAQLVARTHISLTGGQLTLKTLPFSIRGEIAVRRDEIDQLYVQNRPKGGHRLMLRRTDGKEVVLLESGTIDLDEAKVLEHVIETRLGIENRVMLGEVPEPSLLTPP